MPISLRSALCLCALPLVLSACAWTTQTALQEVAFETPGALDAKCDVMAGRAKYVVYPPQTLMLPKAVDMLRVECLAPGGREKTYEFLPRVSPMSVGNVVTGGVPGLAWDHYSGALYYYPDRIAIDFRGVPQNSEPLPNYHNPDVDLPLLAGLDEETPGLPGLNADPIVPARLQKRVRLTPPAEKKPAMLPASSAAAPSAATGGIEGVLERSMSAPSAPGTTADDLTRHYNPKVFAPGKAP